MLILFVFYNLQLVLDILYFCIENTCLPNSKYPYLEHL